MPALVSHYRGRFAPTPSGPLHLGSLLAAVISYLEARRQGGQWLLRMEDLDPPRERPGAADAILRCLETHGLHWDEAVLYQSHRSDAYEAALHQLQQQHALFWCQCSRKALRDRPVYPGACRTFQSPRTDAAIRYRVTDQNDEFTDGFQGKQCANPETDFGDVVLKRRDGYYAYQLAVVVDDAWQGISDVVRGIDLLHASYWQRSLFKRLSLQLPAFHHFPVLIHANGQKLSKQNLAPPVSLQHPANNLAQVFALLQLNVIPSNPEQMLAQAIELWQPESLQNIQSLPITPRCFALK